MARRIKFTKSAITSLPSPPEGSRAEYADTEVTGLRLRITPGGIKTFSLLRRVKNGPMERITLGRFDDIGVERARNDAQKIIGAIADGKNPAEVKRAHRSELTFAELFTQYIERHAKLQKRTWREDQQKYRDYLEKPLANRRISKISRQDLAAIHSKLTHDGHPTVANRTKDLMSSVFGRAVKWGLLENNPAKGIEDNKEISRDRFLLPNELPRFFAALAREPDQAFRDYFLILLLTGARRANVQMMRWPDIDLDHGVWRIPMTKNGLPQNVPLMPEAIDVLLDRRACPSRNATYVFPSRGKYGFIQEPRRAWLRIFDRDELEQLTALLSKVNVHFEHQAGEPLGTALKRARIIAKNMKLETSGTRIQDVRVHDLRRTMGSWQARTGASLAIIGKSLGHLSQQATLIYARLDLDPVRQSMQTATSAMLSAGGLLNDATVTTISESDRKVG